MPNEPDASLATRSARAPWTRFPRAPRPKPDLTLPGQAEGDFVVRDFRFHSGESLPEVRIHYTTLGTPHRDASGRIDNAILLLHGTFARGKQFFDETFRSAMFGAGQPFDTNKYFIVLPDNIGHGESTKPSDQLRGRFPHYTYGDMIELQHRLVTEKLGIAHLRLVCGFSMGGMHTWLWSEKYPGTMDGVIPIGCLPTAITGRNLLWRRIVIEGTRRDPGYHGGDYAELPHGYVATLPVVHMMFDSPAHLGRTVPNVQSATNFIEGDFRDEHPPVDANDAIYALDASREYDPEPDLGKIQARVLAINFADDALNLESLGQLERLMPRVRGGRHVAVPASANTRGHMNLFVASSWQAHVASFLEELPPRRAVIPP